MDKHTQPPPGYEFEVFFDGDCPLCAREIRFLRKLDRKDRIHFVDIAQAGFDAADVGVSWQALMNSIHGRLPDGTLVTGVEVFRRLYAAVGFRSLVWITRMPGIRHSLDFAYEQFAKNRLRLTGRCQTDQCATEPSKP